MIKKLIIIANGSNKNKVIMTIWKKKSIKRISIREQLQILYWRVRLIRKIISTKRQKKNNQKNKNQIEKKKHITNWDWMMKLKKNKNFIKGLRTKIKNQKNKDRSWNLNKYKDNSEILNGQCEIQGYEREKRGGKHRRRQIILPSLPRVVPSWRKQSFNSNNKV